ncbi:MAG: hypothetical protein WAW96_20130 [Alphaproteobacteria bacterium]
MYKVDPPSLKFLYIVLAIISTLTFGAALVVISFFVSAAQFGSRWAFVIALAILAYVIVGSLNRLILEATGKRLIPWLPTPGYDHSLTTKFMLMIGTWAILGFAIYAASTTVRSVNRDSIVWKSPTVIHLN